MFKIKIADIVIEINNRFEYVRRLCEKYVVFDDEPVSMRVRVSDEEIDAEISLTPDRTVSRAYAEGICVYRSICKRLPTEFCAFLMHAAVIEYEGEAYAFAAASGTGKSTHIMQWHKAFGDSVHVINGDKPIMRFVGDRLYAYGTPWCGKEGFSENASAPLRAICFIERAGENSIREIAPREALSRVFSQILTPDTLEDVDALFPLLDKMLSVVPCYVLECNISEEAARVAYKGMNKK